MAIEIVTEGIDTIEKNELESNAIKVLLRALNEYSADYDEASMVNNIKETLKRSINGCPTKKFKLVGKPAKGRTFWCGDKDTEKDNKFSLIVGSTYVDINDGSVWVYNGIRDSRYFGRNGPPCYSFKSVYDRATLQISLNLGFETIKSRFDYFLK